MRSSLIALLLAFVLVLTGCTSALERNYEVVVAHPDYPSTEEDSTMIRVETYQELVNAVLYFVSQGIESGAVRLVNYTQDVDAHLAQACLEVAKEDPLGAYAVDYIKYNYSRAATTYEATIDITYRRSVEQIESIVDVTGTSAIRGEIQAALNTFSTELTLNVEYFSQDEEYIRSLVRQAYYDTPAAAMGIPNYYVNLYPDAGYQRIIEITLSYPLEQSVLLARQNMVVSNAKNITSPYLEYTDSHTQLVNLLADLPQMIGYTPGDSLPLPCTIWDALVGKVANDEGLALGLSLLCNELEIDHTLVEGWLDGAPHYWIIADHIDGSSYHIDLSRNEETPTLYSAQEFANMGYLWEGDYPGVSIPEVEEESDPETNLPHVPAERTPESDPLEEGGIISQELSFFFADKKD